MNTGSTLVPGPIIQDQDGFLWIGAQGSGLLKFNGYDIQRYTAGPGSLSDDIVTALHEDREGLLWIGTSRGLSSYNKNTNSFQTYLHDPETVGSLSSSAFNQSTQTLITDDEGILWAGTSNGLNAFDKATGTFTKYPVSGDNSKKLTSDNIYAVYQDRAGYLWVGTDNGLNKLDNNRIVVSSYTHTPNDAKSIGKGIIHAILEDSRGMLWVGTESSLNLFNPVTETFLRYSKETGNPEGLQSDVIYTMFEDDQGRLWLGHGFNGGGLTIFNPATKTFSTFRHDPKNPRMLSSDSVVNIIEDRSGIIWLVHLNGVLDKYDAKSQKFNIYLNNPDDPTSISDNLVNTSYEDTRGNIWFGTGNGLNRYDRKTGRFSRYPAGTGQPGTLPGSFICGPLEDSSGNFWVLSSDNYISLFDRETGRVTATYETVNNPITVIEDTTNPQFLWIASWGGGLARFDKESHETRMFVNEPDNPGSISNNTMAHIYQDAEGFIWVPTVGGGLDKFDPRSEKVVSHYRHETEDQNSIGSDSVSHIFEDSKGRFWVGTYGGGLNRFDPATETFQQFTTKEGFPTNGITNILEDDYGNLWLGSKIGYIRFHPETGKTRVYTQNDGLAGNEYQEAAMHKAKDGSIWIGSVTGANSFHPRELPDNPLLPPVYISAVRQGGEAIGSGQATERLQEIRLDWRHNYFEFEYVALNFTNTENNHYKYKLEGVDKEWFDAGTRRFGRYSGLAGGDYTLRVIASNNDGIWNELGTSLRVHVEPPWWKNNLAYFLYLLGLIMLVVGVVELRARGHKKRLAHTRHINEKLEAEIAVRRETEDELRRLRNYTANIIDSMPSMLIGIDAHGMITQWNTTAEKSTGISADSALAKPVDDVLPHLPNIRETITESIRTQETQYLQKQQRKAGSGLHYEDVTIYPLITNGQEGAVLRIDDVSGRVELEEQMRQIENRYSLLFNNMLDGFRFFEIIADDDGNPIDYKILEANKASEEIMGFKLEDVKGKRVTELYPNIEYIDPEWIQIFGQVGMTGEGTMFEKYSVNLGKWLRVSAYCPKKGFVGSIFNDITHIKKAEEERLHLEDQLRQVQKMEAIGTLAGGIAHDFNNILSSIFGFTELAQNLNTDNPRAQQHLDHVLTAAKRAKDLVQHLLTFSRKSDVERKIMTITPLVKEAIKFIKASAPSTIAIESEIVAADSCILVDVTQMHQVFMNLFTNAVHAMKDEGGLLKVEITSVKIGADDVPFAKNLAPGNYLKISVSDTGHGIPPSQLDRIFDPFYTTKGKGEGTGLGLSVTYGIIQEMQGHIWVYSEEGKGTTFKIFLPEISTGDTQDLPPIDSDKLSQGEGTILLVDDEEEIILWTSEMLESIGYTVVGMTNALKALETFQQSPDSFDFLLTDLTMPGMLGTDLASAIHELRPELPILMCTGFSEGLDANALASRGVKKILMKPVIMSELAREIKKYMGYKTS